VSLGILQYAQQEHALAPWNARIHHSFSCYMKFFLQLSYHFTVPLTVDTTGLYWTDYSFLYSSFSSPENSLFTLQLWQPFRGKRWLLYWPQCHVQERNNVYLLILKLFKSSFHLCHIWFWRDNSFPKLSSSFSIAFSIYYYINETGDH
jgi:hypothetical protein